MKRINSNRIKKSCTFEQGTYEFIEGYAASLGNISFAEANENLVIQGASNVESQKRMTEQILSAINSLKNENKEIRESIKKLGDRFAGLSVANIKISGATLQILKVVAIENNLTPSSIEIEEKRGIKAGINSMKGAGNEAKELEAGENYDY